MLVKLTEAGGEFPEARAAGSPVGTFCGALDALSEYMRDAMLCLGAPALLCFISPEDTAGG